MEVLLQRPPDLTLTRIGRRLRRLRTRLRQDPVLKTTLINSLVESLQSRRPERVIIVHIGPTKTRVTQEIRQAFQSINWNPWSIE